MVYLSFIGFQTTSSTSTPVTLLSVPRNLTVARFQYLSHPSSWEVDVFSIFPKYGQGLLSDLLSGGFGIISIWVILTAFCRVDVPTQSEPVSPPPITRTFFPSALILLAEAGI